MNEETQKQFEKVLTLIKHEQMTAIDVAEEYKKLFKMYENKVEQCEFSSGELAHLKEKVKELEKEIKIANAALEPQSDIKRDRETLENDKYDFKQRELSFHYQKRYIIRENDILREILSSVLARKEINNAIFTEYIEPPVHSDHQGNWIQPDPVAHQRTEHKEEVHKPDLSRGGLE